MTDAVYEPSYEAYEGSRTSRARRLGAIAGRGWSKTVGSIWFWALLGVSLVHVAIRGGVLYFTGQIDASDGIIPPDARAQVEFTGRFLTDALADQARWVVTFILVVVGADAISEDLDTGGLTFYFTKPISQPGYVAGKLAAPFAACLLVTAGPVLLLWLMGLVFTPEAVYPDDVWLLPFGLLAASIVVSAMTTLVVAALSGLVGSSGRTAVVWIAIVFVLAAAGQVTEAVSGNVDAELLDPYAALDKLGELLTGVDDSQLSGVGAALTVAGWILASLGGLWWTLRREEVAG